MSGKSRILLVYFLVILVGILGYAFVLFVVNHAHEHSNHFAEIASSTPNRATIPKGADNKTDSKPTSKPPKKEPKTENNPQTPNPSTNPTQPAESPLETPSIIETPQDSANQDSTNPAQNLENPQLIESPLIESPQNSDANTDDNQVDSTLQDGIYIVNAKILNVRSQPSTDSNIIKQYRKGGRLSVAEVDGEWGRLANGGFVYMPLLVRK